MDNKEAAYHRKEHILNESSSRLNNLLKGDHEDFSEDDESKDIPVKLDEGEHPSQHKVPSNEHQSHAPEDSEEVVEEGDPSKVRLQGYVEVHLYLFSLLFGAFLCYYRHHEGSYHYYPRFLHNFFQLLKRRGVHRLSDHFFNIWLRIPGEDKKKLIKYMSYATVGVSLYPVFTAPKKPKNPETPEQTRAREAKEKLNKQFIHYSTSVLRVVAASLLCGLVGYDLSYNLDFIKNFLSKR
ncbi:conserved hypothetical protein [Theileria orientalis strain Shintoku]|uniref:Uncharacterized protein n=1 Tax=Theileria orientalis strain Shintoku TaxID=869250 RepID=J4C998_THEOR|nr:conserved hypothetical protein [Theileria orientalis strain Shintoku]BAM42163.1 conserved hypothetical protein [Theileria orientalis strain Shintoku]|eukprot:XP_009692464.1 conserved hypothetical protein [Theileria orientalis strain Shintoku]